MKLITKFLAILFVFSSPFTLNAQRSGEIIYKKVYSSWDAERTEVLKFDGSECLYIEKNPKLKATSDEGYDVTYRARDQSWYLNMENMEVVEQMKDPKKKKYVLWDYQETPYEWEIHDEFKTIGKYRAQKATGMDKNVAWGKATVWFTTEIPLPYGPHRLFGLPGLILEARLEKDFKSKYVFDRIEYKDVENLRPCEGVWIDRKDPNSGASKRASIRKALGSS